MAIRLLKGNKKMYLITVEGLSYLNLTDESVDFTVEFYINGKYNAGQLKILKENVHWMRDSPEYPSDSFHCLVDTTSLDKGQMACDITITYPDADTLGEQGEVVPTTIFLTETVTCEATEVTNIYTR